jgi:hypothetical protein
MKKKCFIVLVIQFFSATLWGQFSFEYANSIPVIHGTDTLKHAWTGGLNNVQISTIDYDFDGDEDLFIFDRSKNNIRLFSQDTKPNGEKKYSFIYNSHQLFPSDLIYRVCLVDYNQDGRKDIFTYGIGGLKVYKNTGNENDGLTWELVSSMVNSQYPNNYTNLYVSSSDIPAIIDVDLDGDIDVLTFSTGGQHVEYHQNQSMELYGIPDSLIFVQMNQCWGKFKEDMNSNSLMLNNTEYPCEGGDISTPRGSAPSSNRHAGSSLLALDYDNSGVMDLIIGDVSYTNLILLINGGSEPNTNSPMISEEYNFPSNSNPVDLDLFPAAFYEDLDFDGLKDLFVGSNAKIVSQNKTGCWFYKNTGTNANPNFIYQTNAFLQKEMIEVGQGSIPTLVDLNGDGLLDLIVGNFYQYKNSNERVSTLSYYRNVGTPNTPVFKLIDNDYLNLSSSGYGYRLAPAFGDLDGDGDQDLVLGREDGTIQFRENIGTTNIPNFNSITNNFLDLEGNIIQVQAYSFPQLFDLNQDGKLDLILGNKDGKISYYENMGSNSSPAFQLKNNLLGGIDLFTESPDGYSTPHFFSLHDTLHLFLGGLDGKLHYYTNIENNLETGTSFDLISSNYLNVEVQGYSSFWVNDINQDGQMNLLVGQDLGGLYHLEVDSLGTNQLNKIQHQRTVQLFPNPATSNFTINYNSAEQANLKIFDASGKKILEQNRFYSGDSVDMLPFRKGIYFIEIHFENGSKNVQKLILVDTN